MQIYSVHHFYLQDDGIFPNNDGFPVIHYRAALQIPWWRPANYILKLFKKNNWSNGWNDGVYDYHHYHSITHEALGVYKGHTILLLGGGNGVRVTVEKGDVLIIPAGVAHKNLYPENVFGCVGAYPNGSAYDMNTGKPGERPDADDQILQVPVPDQDPVFGGTGEMYRILQENHFVHISL